MSSPTESFEAYRRADGEEIWEEFGWVTFADWDDAERSLGDSEERFELQRVRMTVEVIDSRVVGSAENPCGAWSGRPARRQTWFAVQRDVELRDPSRTLFGQSSHDDAARMLSELPDMIHVVDSTDARVILVPRSEYRVVDCSRILPAGPCDNCGHDLAAHEPSPSGSRETP